MELPQFADMVVKRAEAEARKRKAIAPATRRTVDLLFYVNSRDRFMRPPPPEAHDWSALAGLEWRSVSFVYAFFSCVLYAAPEAPDWLRRQAGRCSARDLADWIAENG